MKKNYTISIPAATFWKIIVPAGLFLAVAGLVAGTLVVDRVVMPRVVGIQSKGDVKVPSLAGLQKEEARQALYKTGLRLREIERRYDTDAQRDVVISQQPAPKTSVKKGRYVAVVISKGPEVDTIPATRNLSERSARRLLWEKGFADVESRREYSAKYEKEAVIRTHPEGGVVVSREAPVEIVISNGPRPTHAQAPSIVGDMLSEAKKKIQSSGLKVGKIEYRKDGVSTPGSVISQSAPPGTSVPFETSVNIVVASR
jgi:eukaryotic-like serine/threonine-protein kinase